jgi:hypothetical protein
MKPSALPTDHEDIHRQVAAFHLRVAVLNGITMRGIPVTEATG